MKKIKETQYTDKHILMAKFTKAMSHPARIFILQRLSLMNGCCTSGEMVDDIPIARSTLSQHLKELKHAGLIQGEINPPFIKYCIHRENWEIARELFKEFFD